MTEILHNMPEIPISSSLRVMDKNYLFAGEVALLATSFSQPPDKLERMRIVRDALLQSLAKLSEVPKDVSSCPITELVL